MSIRILLLTPLFYGIEDKIRSVLEELKYEVVWIENKNLTFDFHGTKSKIKLLRRIFFFLFSPQKWYLRKKFKNIENIRFDTLLSINAFIICPYLFKRLKRKNPDLYSVLYLWDSFSKYNWEKELRYFDRVLTFDPKDSKEFNLEYKPNFYISNDQQIDVCEKYDLFFMKYD